MKFKGTDKLLKKAQKRALKLAKKSTKKGNKAARQFVKLGKALLKLDDVGQKSFHKKLMKEKKVGLAATIKLLQSIEKLKSSKVVSIPKAKSKKKAA